MFDRLRRRQNNHTPKATAKAMPTVPTAIPAFAPVDRDEDDGDGEDSLGWKAMPVGVLNAPVSEAESSVHGAVSDGKTGNPDGRDVTESAKVSAADVDFDTEAIPLAVFATDIVGFIAMPNELVAKPGAATIELTAIMQRVCQYNTACVISRDEQRFRRHGVISEMRELDLGHWQ